MTSTKSMARACNSCRTRKIRCDMARPYCTACAIQGRECIYRIESARKRPTFAQIHDLRRRFEAVKSFIVSLKSSSPSERDALLDSATIVDGQLLMPPECDSTLDESTKVAEDVVQSSPRQRRSSLGSLDSSSDEELDVAPFISVDDTGNASSFGPSSALHCPPTPEDAPKITPARSLLRDNVRNRLIANAALQKQSEHQLPFLPDIDGIPTELALHLLDVHWARQHHTFLLTYRPAIMRDLPTYGRHCSRFLLNAIFACSSKYSRRAEICGNPNDSATAGQHFLQRCDRLLAEEALLIHPSVPTVIGLLLLGSTYNSRGNTSKGWLYTGYALRMVYDLGLHLDPTETTNDAEEIEIRRRVFWGAFICDKLQSLYLGRPVAISLRDSHVSRDFLDTFEEQELFIPYIDPKYNTLPPPPPLARPSPIYSVSAFQQLCLLSKIMTKIINSFYVVGATFSNAQACLRTVDNALQSWKQNLPQALDYQPWSLPDDLTRYPAPNVMILHCTYYSMIILLHRPFISDGHLRSTTIPALSWERCTTAARSITSISLAYRSAYGLATAPYLLSYSIYVACTIHVRNAAVKRNSAQGHSDLLAAGLECLDDLCAANPGVAKPASIIRRLIAANKLDLNKGKASPGSESVSQLDVDAIASMFAVPPTAAFDMQVSGMLGLDFSHDPLFGLMEGAFDAPFS